MKKQDLYSIIIIIVGIWVVLSLLPHDEVKLGNNYIYDAEYQHILGAIDVPPVVKNYKYNKRFIVAKQLLKAFNDRFIIGKSCIQKEPSLFNKTPIDVNSLIEFKFIIPLK